MRSPPESPRVPLAAPLYDAAVEELLGGASAVEGSLAARALAGHSPSARALANAGDFVAELAAGAVSAVTAPPHALRERVLAGARRARGAAASPAHHPAPIGSPSEVLGQLHALRAEEPARRALVERLEARGADTPTDRALTRVIEQYGPLLGYEIVFVSTVVDDVTIHRVHRGFPPELGDLSVVPRALSFCTHTVSAGEPFFVEDAAKEAFFRQSELVTKLGARAYLGVPLFAPSSPPAGEVERAAAPLAVGALCGISSAPRPVFPEDLALASAFARVAQALVAHDEVALAELVSDPRPYPVALGEGPALFGAAAFGAMVEAQRARANSSETHLARLSTQAWAEARAALPRGVVAGELDGGVGLLLPAAHPALGSLAPWLAGAERLG